MFVPLVVSWGVLALVVLGLIVYRRMVASAEDDTLHVDQAVSSQQLAVARRLETIDKWGKLLTVIAFVYGLVVAVVYLYNVWNTTPTY